MAFGLIARPSKPRLSMGFAARVFCMGSYVAGGSPLTGRRCAIAAPGGPRPRRGWSEGAPAAGRCPITTRLANRACAERRFGGAADGSCRPGVVGGCAARRHKGGPMGTFGLARSSPPLAKFLAVFRRTLSFPPAFPAGAAPLSSKDLKYLDFLGWVPCPSPSTAESIANLICVHVS